MTLRYNGRKRRYKLEEMYSKEETRSIRTGITALLVILVAVFITVSHNASIRESLLQ